MKGDPLETFKNSRKKSHQAEKNLRKEIFGHGRDSNLRLSAWQTSKTILVNLYAKWQ